MFKDIVKNYIGMVLLGVTVIGAIYLFRKKIFGSVTDAVAPVVDDLKKDLKVIQDSTFATVTRDIWIAKTTDYISPEQFRANIALIDATIKKTALQNSLANVS